MKKVGQLAWVKLLPRLESKGRGSEVVMGAVVATRLVAVGVVVVVVTVAWRLRLFVEGGFSTASSGSAWFRAATESKTCRYQGSVGVVATSLREDISLLIVYVCGREPRCPVAASTCVKLEEERSSNARAFILRLLSSVPRLKVAHIRPNFVY